MHAGRLLVAILFGALALLVAAWGGSLAVSGALGHRSEDLPPAFFVVFGSALLAFAGVLAWAALAVHRRPRGGAAWSLPMFLLLAGGVGVERVTGFWPLAVVLSALVVVAAALVLLSRRSEAGTWRRSRKAG
jgi:hypothetical protein